MDVTVSPEQIAATLLKDFLAINQDQGHIHSFLLGHEQFVPSTDLLSAMIKFYQTSSDRILQFRVFNLIKKWVDLLRSAFLGVEEGTVGRILAEFISNLEKEKADEKRALAVRLKQALSGETILTEFDDNEEQDEEKPKTMTKKKKRGERPEILYYEPEEIARQITLIEHELLVQVDKREMIKTRWMTPEKSPTLSTRSDRTNAFAYWLAYELLACKQRLKLKVLTHFLKICSFLIQFNNYQSLMAFNLGLQLAPLNSLSHLWQQLPQKIGAIWKKVMKLMDYTANYANLREVLLDNPTTNMIPCQEVTLKDLLYFYESSPDFVSPGVVDLQKLHGIGGKIDDFRKCQESVFKFHKYQVLYDYLLNIPKNITVESLSNIGTTNSKEKLDIQSMGESDSSASTASFLEQQKAAGEDANSARDSKNRTRATSDANFLSKAVNLGSSQDKTPRKEVKTQISRESTSIGSSNNPSPALSRSKKKPSRSTLKAIDKALTSSESDDETKAQESP